ncbi:acyl-homoserine-lactone synthase [Marinobacteraceae bacterium S3BR75-40.1]
MHFITGTAETLSSEMNQQLGQYRHKVFIEHLGWQLDTPEGIERDQFDTHRAVYVVSKDGEGQINGCARLLPTTEPYLLADVFPELLNGLEPPSREDVWELSRFAAVDFEDRPTSKPGQFSSKTAVELLFACVRCAREQGAKRLLTVSPLGVERLLRRTGLKSHRAGPPMVIDGYPLFACWINLEDDD